MNKTRKFSLVLVLLAALFLLTACDVPDRPPELEEGYEWYANSRTAAIFNGLQNGKIKIKFTTAIENKVIQGTYHADLGANKAQVHAVRNSYDIYQWDEGDTCYTLDINEKDYTVETASSKGALAMAKTLTTGGDGIVKTDSRSVAGEGDKRYDCEVLYDNDKQITVCYFDGPELKYIKLSVWGMTMTVKVEELSFSFDSSEMNISGFPDQYTQVSELKRLNDLMNRYS